MTTPEPDSSTDDFEFDVFLSHSEQDASVVRPIATRLKNDGLRVWFREDEVKPASNIPMLIQEGLDKSKKVAVFCSQSSQDSDWTKLSWQFITNIDPLNRDGRVVPILLDDTSLPTLLSPLRPLSTKAPDFFDQFIETIRRIVRPGERTQPDDKDKLPDENWIVKTARRYLEARSIGVQLLTEFLGKKSGGVEEVISIVFANDDPVKMIADRVHLHKQRPKKAPMFPDGLSDEKCHTFHRICDLAIWKSLPQQAFINVYKQIAASNHVKFDVSDRKLILLHFMRCLGVTDFEDPGNEDNFLILKPQPVRHGAQSKETVDRFIRGVARDLDVAGNEESSIEYLRKSVISTLKDMSNHEEFPTFAIAFFDSNEADAIAPLSKELENAMYFVELPNQEGFAYVDLSNRIKRIHHFIESKRMK